MVKELLEAKTGKPKIKIDLRSKSWLEKIVLNHLGLSNLNHLRDRYEGVAYMKQLLLRSYSELAIEKYLDLEFLDRAEKETVKSYRPQILLDGKKAEIFFAEYDSYPLISKGDYHEAIITYVNLDTRDVLILGKISRIQLLANVDTSGLSPIMTKTHLGYLKNFKSLESIEEKVKNGGEI